MRVWKARLLAISLAVVLAPIAALAQSSDGEVVLIGNDGNLQTWYCVPARGTQVCRLIFSCVAATQLKVSIADLGASGDKWTAMAYVFGKTSPKKKITAPGAAGVYSPVATLKNGGSTPLYAYIEIRFLRGVAPLGGCSLHIETDGPNSQVYTTSQWFEY